MPDRKQLWHTLVLLFETPGSFERFLSPLAAGIVWIGTPECVGRPDQPHRSDSIRLRLQSRALGNEPNINA